MSKLNIVQVLLRPNVLLAIIGIVAGVTGATAAGRLVQARVHATEAVLNARYLPREVVVAARDLAAGVRIDGNMLAKRRMPRDFLPSGALSEDQVGSLIGRHLSVGLSRGDPLQTANTFRPDHPALSALLRSGGRALTISVDDTNSIAGLLRAGDLVDLYYSRNQGDSTVLAPLLERVEVLAAGDALRDDARGPRAASEGGGGFSTLTIQVTSEDAARVVLAQSSGTLTVLLRSQLDAEPLSITTRNSRYLLTPYKAPVRGGASAETIELIVGGSGGAMPEVSRLRIGLLSARSSGEPI